MDLGILFREDWKDNLESYVIFGQGSLHLTFDEPHNKTEFLVFKAVALLTIAPSHKSSV